MSAPPGGAVPEGAIYCPTCEAAVDDVLEFQASLICGECGTTLEDAALVSQRGLAAADAGPGDAPAEGYGVMIDHGDSGAAAAHFMRAATRGGARALRGAGARPPPDLRSHQQALAGAGGAAGLPTAVLRDAAELLPRVAKAYGENGRNFVAPAVAATAYLAARNLGHAVSLAEIGSAFNARTVAVGRHYILALRLLGMQPPPPQLQALVMRHASVLLPRTFPEHSGNVRSHPVTRSARDLADLMGALDALHGRSAAVAAAALLALAFAAHGGALTGGAAAGDVAALLGFDRKTVQTHAREFESELSKLAPLLPFVAPPGGGGPPPARLLVPHAPLLLRLKAVVDRRDAFERAAAAAGGAGGGAAGGAAAGGAAAGGGAAQGAGARRGGAAEGRGPGGG